MVDELLVANLRYADRLPSAWRPVYRDLLSALPRDVVVGDAMKDLIGMRVEAASPTEDVTPILASFAAQALKVCEECGYSGSRVQVGIAWAILCEAHARLAGGEPVPGESATTVAIGANVSVGAAPADKIVVNASAWPAAASQPKSAIETVFDRRLAYDLPSLTVLDRRGARAPDDPVLRRTWDKLSRPLPLRGAEAMRIGGDDGRTILAGLLESRMPWLSALSDIVDRELKLRLATGRPWVGWPPLLLVGPPGSGKSHWAALAARLSGCPYASLAMGGASDARALDGTSRAWSNTWPSFPALTIANNGAANPFVVLDEIDKAGGTGKHGRAVDVLLAMLEPSTGKAWPDPSLQAALDLSEVSWVLTANEPKLPQPLLSRLVVIEVEGPGPEHADVLVGSMTTELAKRWGMAVDDMPLLPRSVYRALRDVLKEYRSARAAARLLSTAYAALMANRQRRLLS